MKTYRRVIFDCDGILLNTEWIWQRSWREAGLNNGSQTFADLFPKVVGINGRDVDRVLDTYLTDVSAEHIKKMRKDVQTNASKYMKEELNQMPFVEDILKQLEEDGVIYAVATATNRSATEERLRSVGLLDRFSYVLCGDEVIKRKPDPEIYITICKKMGVEPKDTIVIEDTGHGVKAAYAAGCNVIMVPSINPETEEDKARVFAVVKNLHEAAVLIHQTFEYIRDQLV